MRQPCSRPFQVPGLPGWSCGAVITNQVHQQAIMKLAAAALVLAHHADGLKAELLVAADRLLVSRRRIDGEPVVAALLEQEPGEQADRLRPSALTLPAAAQEMSIPACRYLGSCSS